MKVPRHFTREEFYNLVWAKPIARLAEEYSLPPELLHTICKKRDIPKPPVGYWSKRAAGKAVAQTPLPESKDETPISMSASELNDEPLGVFEAREKARAALKEWDAATLVQAHPVVTRTISDLRRAKPNAHTGIVKLGGAGRIGCEISPASIDRLELGLSRIAAAAEHLEIELLRLDKGAVFRCDGEEIGFRVVEIIGREKHVLTEKERAAQEAWDAKQERCRQRNNWDDYFASDPPATPEWDYRPSGLLSLELEKEYLHDANARRVFRDAKIQRLEAMATDVAIGIAVHAAARKAERARREAMAKDIEDRRLARERAARRVHIQQRRTTAIVELLEEVDRVDRLRRLLVRLRTVAEEENDPRVQTFLEFASGELAEREAILGVRGLAEHFERQRVFGEDDDFDFSAMRRW